MRVAFAAGRWVAGAGYLHACNAAPAARRAASGQGGSWALTTYCSYITYIYCNISDLFSMLEEAATPPSSAHMALAEATSSGAEAPRAQQSPHATVQQFISDRPRGAYTTLLVKNGYGLVDWEVHLERLLKSISALDATLSGFYARHKAWAEAS